MQRLIQRIDPEFKPFVGAPIADIEGYIQCRSKYEEIDADEIRKKYAPPPPPEPKQPKWKNPVKFADQVMVKFTVTDRVAVRLSVPYEEAIPYINKGKLVPMPVLVRCLKRCGAPDDILLGVIERHNKTNSDEWKQKFQGAIDRISKKKPVNKVLVSVKKNMIPK